MQTDWFKARMAELGLTQDAIAPALGRDRSQVSRVINGQQRIRLDQVEPLAKILQVSPLELIWRAGEWRDTEIAALAAAWERLSKEGRSKAIGILRVLGEDEKNPPTALVDYPPSPRRAVAAR
jgi:transcriptional regulator with XRE-family HTH domain